MSRERPIPFRWILPVTELLICLALLWPSRSFIAYSVRTSLDDYRTLNPSANSLVIPPHVFIPNLNLDLKIQTRVPIKEKMAYAPAALNIPAGLIQLPFIILNTEKREWVPRGMFFEVWRSLSWPIIGLVFWWIAGRGIEALIAGFRHAVRPRIRWPETLFGLVFFVGGTVLAVGVLGGNTRIDDWRLVFVGVGLALWAIFGAITVAARILQWRIQRRLRIAASAEMDPT